MNCFRTAFGGPGAKPPKQKVATITSLAIVVCMGAACSPESKRDVSIETVVLATASKPLMSSKAVEKVVEKEPATSEPDPLAHNREVQVLRARLSARHSRLAPTADNFDASQLSSLEVLVRSDNRVFVRSRAARLLARLGTAEADAIAINLLQDPDTLPRVNLAMVESFKSRTLVEEGALHRALRSIKTGRDPRLDAAVEMLLASNLGTK